ncbi:MAG TPA: CpaF family protein [Anaerolineales bacterium]|nr:CpaF family protein [Anaerolineales bacterium]
MDGRYRGFWDWSDEPEEAEEPVPSFYEVMEAVRAGEVGDPYGYVLERVRERIRAGGLLSAAQLDHPGEEEEELVLRLALEVAGDYAASAASRGLPRLEGEAEAVAKRVVDDILGWGPLAELMADRMVEEIFINGPDEIWVVRAGRPKERTGLRFTDAGELRRFFNRKLDRAGGHRGLSTKTPWADGRLEDGSRFHGIMPPLVANRDNLVVTIRRFRPVAKTLSEMVRLGSMPEVVGRFVEAAVRARLNVVVSGGTASGKTTFLNACGSALEEDERVVSIEDTPELQVPVPNWVQLVTREPAEGVEAVTMADLVRHALRMKPDRIWLGEARGPEMAAILTAANTGHDGVMFTVHADDVWATLTRIETLVQEGKPGLPLRAIRLNVATALHLVVHLSRLRLPDGSETRRVTGIGEVRDRLEGEEVVVEPLWEWRSETLEWTGNFPSEQIRQRLLDRAGYDFRAEVAQREGGIG